MSTLQAEHFAEYFHAVHGVSPFPWQEQLLHQVSSSGSWPDLLDLPTGTGKTAVLDVALFHLALEAERSERRAPLRMILTVDRRTVVDQAFRRAEKIRVALMKSSAGLLRVVHDRLASIPRSGRPLDVVMLRGGIVRDDSWAKAPDQPLIAVSTVDQVGSRLLFRGYGVSDSMRPIHAGLLGNDAILFLDEVHLAVPFRETLRQLKRYRAWGEGAGSKVWHFVEMSATAGSGPKGETFSLTDADRETHTLRQRLQAKRPTALVEVKVSGDEEKRRGTFAAQIAIRAVEQAAIKGRAVLAVVNRLATAHEVHQLVRQHQEKSGFDLCLVTGRMRPVDRTQLESKLTERVGCGWKRSEAKRAIIVVATQCIEAGADFDFDALVTECASLDALRQRFGRLNRLGETDQAAGWVLVRADSLSEDKPDPIYGQALAKTFATLSSISDLDFSAEFLDAHLPGNISYLLPPEDRAPMMLPAHLDAWAQTSPRPVPDPDIALWLRGVERKVDPEVQIIWRADITEASLRRGLGDKSEEERIRLRLEAAPPTTNEALSIPLSAARRWLARQDSDMADVPIAVELDKEDGELNGRRPFFKWAGSGSGISEKLRPDMTIVVPCEYGGLHYSNWNAAATDRVSDVGDLASVLRGRSTLRLHDEVLAQWQAFSRLPGPKPLDDEEGSSQEMMRDWLVQAVALASGDLRSLLTHFLTGLDRGRGTKVLEMEALKEDPAYFVLVAKAGFRRQGTKNAQSEDIEEVSTEDDGASFTGTQVSLKAHLRGVAQFASDFASRCRLETRLVEDLCLAGTLHDLGKADPRFQRMLHDGSEFQAFTALEPLAKSRSMARDRRTRQLARAQSGYPSGYRHELMSLALVANDRDLAVRAHDWELVLYLVSSHHGWCRPLAPVASDREPVNVAVQHEGLTLQAKSDHRMERLDSGIAERFWRLVKKYGWHQLAYLEAILRLADHRRSEAEQLEVGS